MIENNTHSENSHSALQDFMRNVLQVQNHPQLCVIDDNTKSPPPSPTRTTTAIDLQETKMRWPTSPSTASKSKVGMDRWGDLHYEPEHRQLREEQEQQTKRKGTTNNTNKTDASNHRFHDLQFNDRPLPSSVIGNGHVAMLRQDSLERHFLAVEDNVKEDEVGEEEATVSLPTVPEDESLNAPHVAMTSPKRKRQRHLFKKTGKKETESAKKNEMEKEARDKTSKGKRQRYLFKKTGKKETESAKKNEMEKEARGNRQD